MSDEGEAPARTGVSLDPLRRIEGQLSEVQAALGRLDDGSYGRCRACGSQIDDATLAVEPTATLCARCRPGER